jgi:hypothetical protein
MDIQQKFNDAINDTANWDTGIRKVDVIQASKACTILHLREIITINSHLSAMIAPNEYSALLYISNNIRIAEQQLKQLES